MKFCKISTCLSFSFRTNNISWVFNFSWNGIYELAKKERLIKSLNINSNNYSKIKPLFSFIIIIFVAYYNKNTEKLFEIL